MRVGVSITSSWGRSPNEDFPAVDQVLSCWDSLTLGVSSAAVLVDEDTVVTRRLALALERCGLAEGLSSADQGSKVWIWLGAKNFAEDGDPLIEADEGVSAGFK